MQCLLHFVYLNFNSQDRFKPKLVHFSNKIPSLSTRLGTLVTVTPPPLPPRKEVKVLTILIL